ncbi:MAG TPA: polysaccharide deacetylase family protein [Solirubrobacteraceae bacterium]|nr:polysaccharide deacetylase family protein [Solirubrobacteraceae bacterium]
MDDERRRQRREARRKELARRRRRRLLAGLSLVLALALVVAVAVLASGGGSTPSTSAGRGGGASGGPGTGTHSGTGPRGASSSSASGTSLGRPTGKPGTESAPILMYHVINPAPAGAPFPGLYVSASEFAAQVQALANAGFHAVTLDQLRAYWQDGARLPPGKPIVLSFDNGYQSQYTNALPVLRRMGWVGDENIQLSGLPPSQGGLSQTQIRGLIAAGWELDTQGYSHAELTALDAGELEYQIAGARNLIQRRYGVPVNWFCYPSGHYDASVVAEVKAAGFVGSTTVIPGWAGPQSEPYRLPRLRVLGGTSPQALLGEIGAIRDDPPPPASYTA